MTEAQAIARAQVLAPSANWFGAVSVTAFSENGEGPYPAYQVTGVELPDEPVIIIVKKG